MARDLGRALGCPAHLGALHRTAIGPWEDPGPGSEPGGRLVRGADALPWARRRVLDDREVGELRRERSIPAGALLPPRWRPPAGYPLEPPPPVLGLHRERAISLLDATPDGLTPRALLPGGV